MKTILYSYVDTLLNFVLCVANSIKWCFYRPINRWTAAGHKIFNIIVFWVLPWLNPSPPLWSAFDIFSLALTARNLFDLTTLFLFVCFKFSVLSLAMKHLASCSSTPPEKQLSSLHAARSFIRPRVPSPLFPCVWTQFLLWLCSVDTCPHFLPSPFFSLSQKEKHFTNVWWDYIHGLSFPFPTEFNILDYLGEYFLLYPKKSQKCLKKKSPIFFLNLRFR